ncbi:MAG: hypothetical protein ACFFCP_07820 [Promethearchaeota archaeon]
MNYSKKALYDGFFYIGSILLVLEIIEAVTGVPYFWGIGILGWPFFLGGIAGKESLQQSQCHLNNSEVNNDKTR